MISARFNRMTSHLPPVRLVLVVCAVTLKFARVTLQIYNHLTALPSGRVKLCLPHAPLRDFRAPRPSVYEDTGQCFRPPSILLTHL